MPLTRFGFHFSSVSYEGVEGQDLFHRISETAIAAEQGGFDSIWVPDHVHQNRIGGGPSGPMLDAYTLLSALATRTEHVWLGSLVTPVTFRHPAILAKAITSLDVISGGRAVLGIGAAWDTDEHAAYGLEFPGVKEREDRLEEAVLLCRKMFSSQPATFAGTYFHIEEAWTAPPPVQARIPILVGGSGERRTLATAAKYADAANLGFADAETLRHKLEVLAEHCQGVGRDPSEISTTGSLFSPESSQQVVDEVGELLGVGVEGVVVFGGNCPSPEALNDWGTALHKAFD